VANLLYTKAKEKILSGNINLSSDTIKAVFVDSADYTPNLATHDFLDDVPGGGIVGTAQTLGSKTFTDGTFDAADCTFPSVTGDQVEYILIYKDTGSAATSPLIALYDTGGNLPATPNSGNLVIAWNGSGIFTW
jgi:hypothetical protein